MARRSDHTREQLKNLVIQSGYTLLKSEGPSAFSAREVARSIGYSVGTLYNVFGSFENMMLHIQGAILDDWLDALKDDCGENPNLHELASFYIYYARKNFNTWSALFQNPATDKQNAPEWYKEKYARLFAIVENALNAVVKNPDAARREARIIWSSIHGICLLTVTGKMDLVGEESAEAMMHHLIDTYLKGLSK